MKIFNPLYNNNSSTQCGSNMKASKHIRVTATVYVCLHNITFFYNFLANVLEYYKNTQFPMLLKSDTCVAQSAVNMS